MTKRLAVAVASCLALGACGGGSSGNAAAARSFTYGTPTQSTSLQTGAVDGQLATALSAQSSPSASSAEAIASVSGLTGDLLGATPVAAAPAQRQAVAAARLAAARQLGAVAGDGFDVPSCVTVDSANPAVATVTMSKCTMTVTDTGSTTRIQVDGSLAADRVAGTLAWSLTVVTDISETMVAATIDAALHESGKLTVTDTSIAGELQAELSGTETIQNQKFSFGVDEDVTLDLSYAGTPACVTGGTLEAKRVWTVRPAGASATQLPDEGALVTWTACGQGTIAFSQ